MWAGQRAYRPLSTPQQIGDTLDALLDKANRIGDPFEQFLPAYERSTQDYVATKRNVAEPDAALQKPSRQKAHV